jgi:hypothetical protein
MSATRRALGRQHIETTLIGIFNMQNDDDKKIMLEYLQKQYPQFDISILEMLIGILKRAYPNERPEPPCLASRALILLCNR